MKDFFIQQNQDCNVCVGGVISLMNFADDNIIVKVKRGSVEIKGKNLIIERFDENEITIVGRILGVMTNVNH